MDLEYQFATAWMVEIDGRKTQVLVFLWTDADAERDGELEYTAYIKSWYQDICVGFAFHWPEDKRSKAKEFMADVCLAGSDSRKNVEGALRTLLKDDGLEILG